MPLSPGARLGPYEVLAPIGVGGMGEVYRARDTRLGREVALKVLPDLFADDPERLARFQREAQVLAALNHPNIAAIHGLEEAGPSTGSGQAGVRALVLELVEGPTLAECIAAGSLPPGAGERGGVRGIGLPIDEALQVARQIAEALEAAHEHGIVHRDLKPANIKVKPDGTVKVLDFGLAKALESGGAVAGEGAHASQSPTLTTAGATRAGVIVGTAAYMSPDQARGRRVDKRADVWAFGCVLYEMLTGRRAFAGDEVSDTLAAVLRAEPDWSALPRETPPHVQRGLRRCLEKDVSRRARDIRDLRLDLEFAPEEPAAPAASALARKATASRPAWIVAACLGAIAVIAGAVALRPARDHSRVTWLSISPPPGAAFATPAQFAVAPDGERFTSAIVTDDGTQVLWVRALGSSEGQILPGSDGAEFPFWSPDSRFIGFFAGGKLKKIEASGGAAQTLCDVRGSGRGGSWSRDGLIVFTGGGTGGGLWRVSAEGGQPVEVTKLDESRQENSHRWPYFLPDGRHFLFVARSARPEDHAVYGASVDTSETKRVLAALSSVAYAPPGYLLFVRDTTLFAQGFDANRLRIEGEPVPVARGVSYTGGTAQGAFSVSSNAVNAVLVIREAGSDLREDVELEWLDRNGERLGGAGPGLSPKLSPDERRVAVTRVDEETGTGDIWLIDLTRGHLSTRFTFDPRWDQAPVWSPDGLWVAFRSAREGATRAYLKASSGAQAEEPLRGAPQECTPTDWSRHGRLIILECLDPKTREDLWYLPLEGDRKPVAYLKTDFTEAQGRLSPDGRWMAYTSDESGRREVYVQSFPAREEKWKISGNGGAIPVWRRDGGELFYVGGDGVLMVVTAQTGARFQAAAPRALFQTNMRSSRRRSLDGYDVGADGVRFLLPARGPAVAGGVSTITVVLNWTAGLEK